MKGLRGTHDGSKSRSDCSAPGLFHSLTFEMDDKSLRDAIDSKDESYIRSVIRPKIKACEVCVCLVGENTFRSRKWVPWEIGLAIEERKRVIAMKFWDTANATTPAVLTQNGPSVRFV